MDRHVILTLGRSGSNTLANLLNQHPDMLNIGEVLGPWNSVRKLRDRFGLYKDDTGAYLDALTRRSALIRMMSFTRSIRRLARLKPGEVKPLHRVRTLGFKEFATLMVEHGQRDWLRDRPDVKVIGLVRDDIVDRLVSWQVLEQTGVVLTRGEAKTERQSFEIDPAAILGLLETIDRENRLLVEMLEELPSERVRILRYGDFYRSEDQRREMLDAVFAFLGLRPWETEIRMKKIVSVPPAQLIDNRDACSEALRGTRFEGVLELPRG